MLDCGSEDGLLIADFAGAFGLFGSLPRQALRRAMGIGARLFLEMFIYDAPFYNIRVGRGHLVLVGTQVSGLLGAKRIAAPSSRLLYAFRPLPQYFTFDFSIYLCFLGN